MYYSPKRVFAAIAIHKGFLNIHLFTNGKRLKGVESFTGDYGYKWGRIYVRSKTAISNVILVFKRSHQMINQCIKDNIPIGWYAEVE